MKVSEAMTRDVHIAGPEETICDAARAMAALDVGALPVEDEDLDHVAANMADIRVRRLPVVSRDKRLVGIVSLGDVAMFEGRRAAGEAISGVSRPGGPHSQTAH